MIDISSEEIFPLTQAPDLELGPKRRRGKKTHVSTFFRWAKSGCRGIRLETLRYGGTLCTSVQALQRFCEALTQSDGAQAGPPMVPKIRTEAEHRRDVELAKQELVRRGM